MGLIEFGRGQAGTAPEQPQPRLILRRPWTFAFTASTSADPVAALAEVAETHQPQGGYGEMAWRAATRSAWWNAADWTSDEEIDAVRDAVFEIETVRELIIGDEDAIPDGEGWTVVWSRSTTADTTDRIVDDPPFEYAVTDEGLDAAFADVLALAAEPLPELTPEDWNTYQPKRKSKIVDKNGNPLPSNPPPADPSASTDGVVTAALEAISASGADSRESLRDVLEVVASAHRTTMDAIAQALTAAGQPRDGDRADVLTAAALGVLSEFARRPNPEPAAIHVTVPERQVQVEVQPPNVENQIDVHVPEQPVPLPAQVTVNVPEQPVPQVTVAAAPAPHVTVEASPPTPVEVTVNVPDEIRTVPAEVETVAERNRDGLVTRSVTRPTGT